jgi:hypothetical protein
MRILHAPENICGIAGILAREQTHLGHIACSYTVSQNDFKFSADFIMKNPQSTRERLSNAVHFAVKFDIFQFYFGASLLGYGLQDVPWLVHMGKKIFFYFHGCDIRDEKRIIMQYPASSCAYCFPKLCNANRQYAKKIAEKYGRVNFVSTPDLLESVDRSILLPQVIDFDLINQILDEPRHPRNPAKLIVAHAPTNRAIKGSNFIIDAINHLKKKGLDIDLLLLENLSHDNLLRNLKTADIAIDQLLVGAYGVFAAEAMAMGIPTIVNILDDLWDKYPSRPPVIHANPGTIERTLEQIYNNRQDLEKYRFTGQTYAYRVHHPVRVAIQCLEYYEL